MQRCTGTGGVANGRRAARVLNGGALGGVPVERQRLQVLTSPRKPRIPPGPEGCVLEALALCEARRVRAGDICGALSGPPAHGPLKGAQGS